MNVYLSINDIKKNNNCEIDLRDYIRYLYPKKNTIIGGYLFLKNWFLDML